MKKFVLLCLLFNLLTFAQAFAQAFAQDEQFQKQIEEIMRAREEMLKSLMDDSFNSPNNFESRMEEIMKRFGGGSFGQNLFDEPEVAQSNWEQTDSHRILKIKVEQTPDRPLDIKIEKGMVRLKGEVVTTQGQGKNRTTRKMNFERSFSLPNDVDQTNPEFENKKGEVWIKFKLLSNVKSKVKTINSPPVKRNDERIPVEAEKDEIKI